VRRGPRLAGCHCTLIDLRRLALLGTLAGSTGCANRYTGPRRQTAPTRRLSSSSPSQPQAPEHAPSYDLSRDNGERRCQTDVQSQRPEETSARGKHPPRRRVSSCMRKSTRSARGEHGARSPQQAIAIGLSKARRAGVNLSPPKRGRTKESTRKSAEYAYAAGQHKRKTRRRPRVSRAVTRVLKREPRRSASHKSLSRQAKQAASRRAPSERSAAARKAARTKGATGRSTAARKAARTRTRRRAA
jgi:hypothetical protein